MSRRLHSRRDVGFVRAPRPTVVSVAGCWLNATASATANDHMNVSSITDNAASDWTVNFARPFATANFVLAQGAQGAASAVGYLSVDSVTGMSTTAVRVLWRNTDVGAGGGDIDFNMPIFIGRY